MPSQSFFFSPKPERNTTQSSSSLKPDEHNYSLKVSTVFLVWTKPFISNWQRTFFFLWIPWIQYRPFLFQSQWSLWPNPQTREDKAIRGSSSQGSLHLCLSEFLSPLCSTWNHSSFRAMRDLSPTYPYPERFHPLQGLVPRPKNSDISGMLGRWATCID